VIGGFGIHSHGRDGNVVVVVLVLVKNIIHLVDRLMCLIVHVVMDWVKSGKVINNCQI